MEQQYSIRRASLNDKAALTELCLRSKKSNGYDEAFMARCVDELTVRDSWILEEDFWIAEVRDGPIIGCVRLAMDEKDGTGELETCFVDPDWQGRQLGKHLVECLLARARALKIARIGLDADPFAENFYARMGFRTVGMTPSGSIAGRFLPRMEMDLKTGIGEA